MPAQWRAAAIGAGVLVAAAGAFFLLASRDSGVPGLGRVLGAKTCPLTGVEPDNESLLDRPALAVKVENAAVAYPLSGLEKADVVFEEAVEGGITRFMAIYHCRNTAKAGPVRSARLIDPAIMTPTTRLLAFSGGNRPVLEALRKAGIVMIQESDAGGGMRRIAREGVTSEHTLYADTAALRRLGSKKFDDSPPEGAFEFGDAAGASKRARRVTINFSGATQITYDYKGGRWLRSQNGARFMSSSGDRIGVDNVLVEVHEVVFSKTIVDVAGNPSVEIADPTGSGRAVLFRDGRAIRGRWVRPSIKEAVRFETRAGDAMTFKPGTIWVELVPSGKGDVKGSFSYAG
jgi:Protein of unknown function (DUF3048) N-terminal domain/Protein of unknown function (DUF3048) C-terminal domain